MEKKKHYKYSGIIFTVNPYRIIEKNNERKWVARAIIRIPSGIGEKHIPISIGEHFKDEKSAIQASKKIAINYISSNIKG